jgi:hypothetical protein
VTKDRHTKDFDPAVLAAMKWMETTSDAMKICAPTVHQINQGGCAKLLKARRGEVAERLNAAVC